MKQFCLKCKHIQPLADFIVKQKKTYFVLQDIDKKNNFDDMRPFWRKLGDLGLLGITASSKVHIQGGTSHCSLGCVDMKIEVVFYYLLLIIKRNFQIKSTGGFVQAA